MKTLTELSELLNCTWYKAKRIAKSCGWNRVMKNTKCWLYDVTDQEITAFIENQNGIIDVDYTLKLYKLTLGWGNGIQPLQKRR